jgi:hypothetical protein
VFAAYAQGRYTEPLVFLNDFASHFCRTHLRGHELRVLTFLIELRLNGPSKYQVPALNVVQAIMRNIDVTSFEDRHKVLSHLMVLRQLAESDTWEAVAGVFDATVAASRYVQQQQQ